MRSVPEGSDAIDLSELGAGEGRRPRYSRTLLTTGVDFQYEPIDISQEANDALETRFKEKFPDPPHRSHTGDYFQIPLAKER